MSGPEAKNEGAPPVSAWVIAILFTGVCGGASVWLLPAKLSELDMDERAEMLEVFNVERFEAYRKEAATRAEPRPMITVMGSSLTETAFAFDHGFEKTAAAMGFDNLRLIRLIHLGFGFERFFHVFDHIIDAGPRLVVIEASMIVHLTRGQVNKPLDRHRIHYRNMIFGAPKEPEIQSEPPKKKKERSVPESKLRAEFQRAKRINREEHWQFRGSQWGIHRQSPHDLAETERRWGRWQGCSRGIPGALWDFLEKARDQGIKVVILNLSGSEEAQRHMPAQMKACFESIPEKYGADLGVEYVAYSTDCGLKCYRDFTHLNRKGRRLFTHWFLNRYADLIRFGSAE